MIRRLLSWLLCSPRCRPRTLAELPPLERMMRLNMMQTTPRRRR